MYTFLKEELKIEKIILVQQKIILHAPCEGSEMHQPSPIVCFFFSEGRSLRKVQDAFLLLLLEVTIHICVTLQFQTPSPLQPINGQGYQAFREPDNLCEHVFLAG